MNSDIRISVGFLDHPKTIKLRRRVGNDAVLCLMRLWFYAAQYKPSGHFNGMTDEDLEIAANWSGECGEFVRAACDVGFIDRDGASYVLHDWDIHNSWAFHAEERSKAAKEKASKRWAKKSNTESNAVSNADSNANGNAPSPNPIPLPNPIPNPSPSPLPLEKIAPAKAVASRQQQHASIESFEIFWDAFDYKKGRQGALQSWKRIKMTGDLFDRIIEGARREAANRPSIIVNRGTPKWAQGWLTERRWEDEHIEAPVMSHREAVNRSAIAGFIGGSR